MKFVKMHGLGNDFVFFGGEDAQRVEENGPAALAQKLANAALQCGKIHRLCKMAVHPALCRKPLIFHKSIGGKCKHQHGLGVRAVHGFFFRVNLLQ